MGILKKHKKERVSKRKKRRKYVENEGEKKERENVARKQRDRGKTVYTNALLKISQTPT